MIHHTSHPVGYWNQIRSGLSLSPKPALASPPPLPHRTRSAHTSSTHPEPESGFPAVQSVRAGILGFWLGGLDGQRGEMDRGVLGLRLLVSGKRGSLGAGMRKRAGGEGWGIFSLCKKKWGC